MQYPKGVGETPLLIVPTERQDEMKKEVENNLFRLPGEEDLAEEIVTIHCIIYRMRFIRLGILRNGGRISRSSRRCSRQLSLRRNSRG
jgi:hypothetical protein